MSVQVALGEPTFGEEEIEAIRAVFASGWVAGQGPKNRELEAAFADFCQTPHAIALNNCTAALHLALLAYGVGPGDEVIVADYTFPATGHAVLYTGATPVFADVRPDIWSVDPAAVEALVTERTVGVIGVDVLGQMADWDQLRALTSKRGLFLIEDAACSAGATFQGKPSGHPDLADIATFSLHGRKGITCGEGGLVTTGHADHAATMRRQMAFGIESALARAGSSGLPIPVFGDIGYNYKLSDIAAAIALVQLGKVDQFLKARRAAAQHYDERFADLELVETPFVAGDRDHTWQSYILTLHPSVDRGRVAMALRGAGIGANIGTYASHLQPVYDSPQMCPVSADIFARHLAIPMHANLDDEQIDAVVNAVRAAVTDPDNQH